jgi:hypothetical protein
MEQRKMAIPHYNYRPPAGSVIDQNDPRLRWDGQRWMLGGRAQSVPSSHRLVGAPNGPLRGWFYDWGRHAWMQPSPQGGSGPKPPAPQPPPPQPAPIQQQPMQQPAPSLQVVVKEEQTNMEKTPKTILEDLVKHPVAPVLGGLLVIAGYVVDEPQPPTIPDGLPEPIAKQWQMIYAQNVQRFERRMSLYRDIGMVLLGYAGTRSIVDVLGGLDARRALEMKKLG